MAIKANVKAIEALKPRTDRYDTSIAGRPGLVVRQWPSGKRTFLHRFKLKGETFKLTIGDFPARTLESLLAEHQAQRTMIAKGENPAAAAQREEQSANANLTIKALGDRYMKEHAEPNKRSAPEDRRTLDADVLPRWGKLLARDITFSDVDSLIGSIRRNPKRGKTAPRRVLAMVRKMFSFAVKKRIVPANPARGVEVPKAPAPRERSLSDAELRTFIRRLPASGLSPDMQDALRLQLLLGSRIGEIVGIEWREVDFDAGLWTLPASRSKNRMPNLLPIAGPALRVLERRREATGTTSRYAFPGTPGRIEEGGKRTIKPLRVDSTGKALRRSLAAFTDRRGRPIDAFATHDIRRTVETGLARLGVGREIRDRILNHKDQSVSGQHYNKHDFLPEKAKALELWATHLRRVGLGKPKPSKVVPLTKAKRASVAAR